MKRLMIAAVFLMGSASLGYAGDDPKYLDSSFDFEFTKFAIVN